MKKNKSLSEEQQMDALIADWRKQETEKRQQKIKDKAVELGCPDNLLLAEYLMDLESKVHDLENKVYDLEVAQDYD